MSQISKRNANEAFVNENTDGFRTKRRRTRARSSLPQSNGIVTDTIEGSLKKNVSTAPESAESAESAIHTLPSPNRSPHPNRSDTNLTIGYHVVTPHDSSQSVEMKTVDPELGYDDYNKKQYLTSNNKALAIQGKKKKSRKSKAGRRSEQVSYNLTSWKMSMSSGGTFINHDPVLTSDNKYVILATVNDIQIFSATTSLLVRSIQSGESSQIVSYILSATYKSRILVGLGNGLILMYDLGTGRKLDQWQGQIGLTYLVSTLSNDTMESVLAIRSVEGQDSTLQRLSLFPKEKLTTTNLLQRPNLQSTVMTSADGSALVVFTKDKIYTGYKKNQPGKDSSNQTYTWHGIPIPGRIVSCDVLFAQTKSKQTGRSPRLNVVVGLQNGAILVYQDLLHKLVTKEKEIFDLDIRSRRLHWHRTAVRSVKWSRDGNYLISGGDESVLVIWQLETNQKQFLPHLSTSILNITVSESGAYYALRLADNSVMVLSTTDLTPSTNIVGLSLRSDQGSGDRTMLHPNNSSQLLTAVPMRSVGGKSSAATHLQTFDIDTNSQVSKQALARNLITAVNIGPNGSVLHEPDVAHIDVSYDGKWLATIDEWFPDPLDVQAMYLADDQEVVSEISQETTMRFWNWSTLDNNWEPITRVNQPHTPSKSTVLAMARNPVSLGFTTMGGDGCLKIWTPKARVRDGVIVRNAAGEPLYTWSCSRQYQIEKNDLAIMSSEPLLGALAYSEDGTVLAASWSPSAQLQRYVHLINTRTGAISASQPQLLSAGPAVLCFLGRYLIALSNCLMVFDTVTLQITANLSFDPKFAYLTSNYTTQHNKYLAVSVQTNTFAVGMNSVDTRNHRSGLVSVFDIGSIDQGTKADFDVPGGIRALIADPGGRGFVVIDREARIRKVTPPGAAVAAASIALIARPETSMQMAQASKGLEDIFGATTQGNDQADVQQRKLLEAGDVVEARSRTLDDLLSSSSTAATPDVDELFERVAKAVAGVRVGA